MVFRSECVYIYNPFVVGMILLEMGVGCLFFFQGFCSVSGTSFEFFFRLVSWSTRYWSDLIFFTPETLPFVLKWEKRQSFASQYTQMFYLQENIDVLRYRIEWTFKRNDQWAKHGSLFLVELKYRVMSIPIYGTLSNHDGDWKSMSAWLRNTICIPIRRMGMRHVRTWAPPFQWRTRFHMEYMAQQTSTWGFVGIQLSLFPLFSEYGIEHGRHFIFRIQRGRKQSILHFKCVRRKSGAANRETGSKLKNAPRRRNGRYDPFSWPNSSPLSPWSFYARMQVRNATFHARNCSSVVRASKWERNKTGILANNEQRNPFPACLL